MTDTQNKNSKEYKLVNVTDSEFPKYKAYSGTNIFIRGADKLRHL